MVSGTKTFTKAELFELFQLASKFNNDQGLLPITIANFTDEQANQFADAYLEALSAQNTDFEPLGRKLKRVTDQHVEVVIDATNAPEAPTTKYNAVTTFTNAAGKLFVGTGNPAGELTIATDGKLELGLGVRRYRDTALPVPVGNVYTVELKDGGDWNVPFSAGLLDGTTTTTNVTELYDVSVTFFGTAAGAEGDPKLTLKMTGTPKGYDWVSTDGSYHAVVDTTNDNKSVGQDIQRYSFFAATVDPTALNGDVLTGDFKITLQAIHKKTQKVLEVSVLAKVKPFQVEVVEPEDEEVETPPLEDTDQE